MLEACSNSFEIERIRARVGIGQRLRRVRVTRFLEKMGRGLAGTVCVYPPSTSLFPLGLRK